MFLLVLYFTHLISDDPTTDHWFRNSPPAASCLSVCRARAEGMCSEPVKTHVLKQVSLFIL